MTKKAMYRIRRIEGIALLILGIHLLVAYFNKVLPFGLGMLTNDLRIIGIWAYIGIWVALICMAGGVLLIFNRLFNFIADYFISLR